MAMKLSLTPRAANDIKSIRDYLIERNPEAADRVRLAIVATFALLEQYPRSGRERTELEVRSIAVTRYPYTVYYRLEAGEVVNVHVRNDRRRPPAPEDL